MIGEDINFKLHNSLTDYDDNYIAEISEITDKTIIISRILVNGNNIKGKKEIFLKDILENSCKYVYVS